MPTKLCPINKLDSTPQKRTNMVKRSLSNRQTDRVASEGRTVFERSFSASVSGLRGSSDGEICADTKDGVVCMPKYGANH